MALWQSADVANRFTDKLSGFASLSAAEIAALEKATSRPRELPGKSDLIREGDRPGSMFVILEGWACRYKILPGGTRQILAFLMPGDTCDLHIDLLAEMDHSIQTIGPAVVSTIEGQEVERLLDQHRGIARAMYISQLIDEGTMRAWITSIGRRNSIERLAHLLCEMYLRARSIGLIKDDRLSMPLSQTLLADALGMTPVHLNRVLKKLRAVDAVVLERTRLTIADPDRLARFAGFDENYLHRKLRAA